jgi:hypothetical protein
MAIWIIVGAAFVVVVIIVVVLGVVLAGTGERAWSTRFPRVRRLFHRQAADSGPPGGGAGPEAMT